MLRARICRACSMQACSWRTVTTPAHARYKAPARASDTARAHTDTDLFKSSAKQNFLPPQRSTASYQVN
eukprot:6357553-Amphidinium_carterae.2